MNTNWFEDYKASEIAMAETLGFGAITKFRLRTATTEEEIMAAMRAARKRKYGF